MVLVAVAMVCVDIRLLLCVSLTDRPIGVSCWVSLFQCGLPELLALIVAGAFLICTLIEGIDSSSVSG